MNQEQINKIRQLSRAAQHSVMAATTLVGDTQILKVLAKWPDVTDSILDYEESKCEFSQIVDDIAMVIRIPLMAIASSYVVALENSQDFIGQIDSLRKRQGLIDPLEYKAEITSIINEMAARDERLQPIPGDTNA